MNSNSSQNNKNNKNNKNNNQKKEFFQLTGQQLSVNLGKYEKVLNKPQVTIFNKKQLEEIEEEKREKHILKRINSTDSAMLEESAYIVLDDPELKLEKRIENCEKALKEVTEKIIVAETIKDSRAIKNLSYKKNVLEKNLLNLQTQYKQQNFETELTSIITKILLFPSKVRESFNRYLKTLLRHSKLLRRYTPIVRSMMVRETLGKLDKINKSVDELVKMKVPFGEQEEKYETLVNHLSRAGALHAQILKELKS